MSSNDFFLVASNHKTLICKVSESLCYEYPVGNAFKWGVYKDRYFVSYEYGKDGADHKLFCCDSYTGEFGNIGSLKYQKIFGLYRHRQSRAYFIGSDKLDTKKMCLDFDLKELKFEGLHNSDIDHAYSMAGYYVVLLERETEDSTTERIYIYDKHCSLISKISFTNLTAHIELSLSADEKTLNVAGSYVIKRFDLSTGQIVAEPKRPEGIFGTLYGDICEFTPQDYTYDSQYNNQYVLYDLATLEHKELKGRCDLDSTGKYLHCFSENEKELIRIKL